MVSRQILATITPLSCKVPPASKEGIIVRIAMKISLAILLAALTIGAACAQFDWKVGRATFYGTDGWSIHQGSCGFYYIFQVPDPSPAAMLRFVDARLCETRTSAEQDSPLGWDVAAMTDVNPLYAGSCGWGSQHFFVGSKACMSADQDPSCAALLLSRSCFEVKCDPSKFKDGDGKEYDRTQVCKNPDQSLVFRTTDTCPCNYAANAASNKRW